MATQSPIRGAAPAQIRDLAALRWLHAGEAVFLHGQVVGKTHVAQALGHPAVRGGAETRFLKTTRALAHPALGARMVG